MGLYIPQPTITLGGYPFFRADGRRPPFRVMALEPTAGDRIWLGKRNKPFVMFTGPACSGDVRSWGKRKPLYIVTVRPK